MPLQPSSIARTGESKQKAALKDRDKKKKAPKKNSAESIETEDTIVEKLQNAETRKKAAAHQIAVSTLAMKRQFCPICHVVTENFEEHHKGKMHQCILKMMPKEERDKYRMHEGKLENREKKRLARKREEKSKQRLSHADDLMANEQQRKRPREDGEDGDDGDVAGEDQLRPRKRQKKKVLHTPPPPHAPSLLIFGSPLWNPRPPTPHPFWGPQSTTAVFWRFWRFCLSAGE